MSEMLGRIIRIQIQAEPLKATGRYDPDHLVTAEKALIGESGMLIRDDNGWIVDAHHRAHPRARGGGNRALSIGFTAHYEAMARRFESVPMGIAGENIVVDGPAVRMDAIRGGLFIRRSDGAEISLDDPRPAAPCRPFTSFLLGSEDVLQRAFIQSELAFLSEGTRGFLVSMDGVDGYVEIKVGDEVFIR
ncbi:MAG: hypothetical protein U9N78_00205 [Actinomycetota bacterium]|nr:hypothetical protein [Actinomycetota bacterium]